MATRPEAWRTAPDVRTRRTIVALGVLLATCLLGLAAGAGQAPALGVGTAPDLEAARQTLGADRAAMTTVASAGRAAGVKRAAPLVRARALHAAARKARAARMYTRASALYERARASYLKAGRRTPARACLTALQDIYLITGTYSATRADMLEALAEMYPTVPADQRAAWLDLPSTESLRWDGVKHYFYEVPLNLAFRDVGLFQSLPDHVASYEQVYGTLRPYLEAEAAAPAWQPYAEPRMYEFRQTLAVPRSVLPATGSLRAWLPVPIIGGPQSDVRITNMDPATLVDRPPSIADQIGLVTFRVPLGQLDTDLRLSFNVRYTHSAQYFKIRPSAIGPYDTGAPYYRRYTASRGNTRITPAIRRTAKRVAGSAKNPYYQARRLYRYILDDVKYSLMPHAALWPRGQAESVYVHQRKYGDCGAQAMYFVALCRSLGIPARTTGGFQTFRGTPSGHFWAEFYLPGYGWIPVDPTAATMVDYLETVSPADKAAFHDFYFGNQDDLRLVVQKDTDLPLIPRATMRTALPLAVQMPAATCDTFTGGSLGLVLSEYWSFTSPKR
ncbi:MAG: transglutaminase domain-containing protein [Actinobacteria bacterium]|nr:transglutaminase domain-containing protein [Actinomycetota bacterium]